MSLYNTLYSRAQIEQTGVMARTCLTPGQRGKVLAAFSKAIYLLTETDELFWITTEDMPLHQRAALTAAPLLEPSVGASFHVEDRQLKIDPGFILDFKQAVLWRAPRLSPDHLLEISRLSMRLHSLFSNLDLAQARGFGVFIPQILSLARNESMKPVSALTDPTLRFAQALVLDMARACLKPDPARISEYADRLVGLGSGLTPSGDDFLGGLLFAVNILQAAYPESKSIDLGVPVEIYRARTHLISFTLLNDLAHGQASAPLHDVINGLLRAEPLESLYPFITRLTQIGHSTGWDMLAGLLTGLLLTYRNGDFLATSQMEQSIAT